MDEVGDIDLEEARDMGRHLYRLRHAVGDDPADRIHRDHPILCPDLDRRSCDLWACGAGSYARRAACGTGGRSGGTLLLLDIADNISLTYSSAEASSLDAVELLLAHLGSLSSLKHYGGIPPLYGAPTYLGSRVGDCGLGGGACLLGLLLTQPF